MTLAFDLLLVLVLIGLAWRALAAEDLFQGVVLYIVFGLLLALAWVRLGAPDIALAEAAIGSGLTGALLLSTLARIDRMERAGSGTRAADTEATEAEGRREAWLVRAIPAGIVSAIVLVLGWVVYNLPREGSSLANVVREQLPSSGVSHPVTAVLLNFRAYDTLLEVGVLLLAVTAAWALARTDASDTEERGGDRVAAVPVVQVALVHLLVPVMGVTAGYLLWRGSFAPGGAFQAGALLGGAGVLVILSRSDLMPLRDRTWLRRVVSAGLVVFLAMGLLPLIFGRSMLQYPVSWAGVVILAIEAAATLSIGATLALLFWGRRPVADSAADSSAVRDRR